jgi:NADH dehydrogenase [ubiquinone] 1 alpha subcomplex assembly factor 3
MLQTSITRLAQPLTARTLHTTRPVLSLQNIFETSDRPSLTIAKLTPKGFHLSDDLVVPGGLVLAGYQALLWNVDPPKGDGSGGMEEAWKGWTKERFQVFESVVPRPGQLLASHRRSSADDVEILLFGTGQTVLPAPKEIKDYISSLGIQLDVMDSVSLVQMLMDHQTDQTA